MEIRVPYDVPKDFCTWLRVVLSYHDAVIVVSDSDGTMSCIDVSACALCVIYWQSGGAHSSLLWWRWQSPCGCWRMVKCSTDFSTLQIYRGSCVYIIHVFISNSSQNDGTPVMRQVGAVIIEDISSALSIHVGMRTTVRLVFYCYLP